MKFNHCDYDSAYILVRGDILVTTVHATEVAFKNCVLFTKRNTKIDRTTIDDVENLDLIVATYYLLEYCSNNSKTTVSLWF